MDARVYRRQADIQGSIPLGTADIGTAMAPSMALAGAILTAGRSVGRVMDQQAEARRVNELSERTLEASRDFDELDARMDQQTDWEQVVPEYEAGVKQLQTKYGQQIQDPVVRRMFAQDFQKMSIRGTAKARELARRKETDFNKANLFTILETYSDDIATAPDFESASMKIGYARAAIMGAVQAGTIGEEEGVKKINDFTEKAQVNFIRREMLADPEEVYTGLVSGAYPELDEARKTVLLSESQKLSEAVQRDRIHLLEKAERDRDKAKKDAQEAAYGDALVMYSEGTLTEPIVQRLISQRKIDPDKGSHLLTVLRQKPGDEKVRDNPVIVGRIASALEMGSDISADLESALQRSEIKPETYISLKKQAGDRDFKRGIHYINNALKPGEMDKWTPDKHIRHAEAVEEYASRVSAGENPLAVSRDVVETFTSDVRRTIRGIAAPRYLTGDKTNLQALQAAQQKTAEALEAGKISVEDFNREAERIRTLMDLATQLNESEQTLDPETKKRAEAMRKKSP